MLDFFTRGKRKAAGALAFAAVLAFSLAMPVAVRAAAADVPDHLRGQISTLNVEVKKKKEQLDDLQRKAEAYRRMIEQKKIESASIEDEVGLLDNRIAKAELDISIAEDEIKTLELEIEALKAKIEESETKMSHERLLMSAMMRKLQRLQFGRSTFEILLSHSSFSEFFDELHSVAQLQSGVREALRGVQRLRLALEDDKQRRVAKQTDIGDRKRDIEAARTELEDQRAFKTLLLEETKESELEYRYLLGDLKREQNDADSEIVYLEKALRDKLNLADRLGKENAVLSWPLVPARGISARFHDPDYPFRNVFEHPAIDIRASQSTAVRAAAAGIVARAKDAGMGYSYVMIIHNNGLSTVYGHLSRILAKEDSFIERGELLGYSGGTPGTPGAGKLTTGAHLHFETRIDGIPVDPLKYLVAP